MGSKDLSFAEYKEIAELCSGIRNQMFELMQLARKLPKNTNQHVVNAITNIDKFRSQAEDKMFDEYPEFRSTYIFYRKDDREDPSNDLMNYK